MPKTEQKKYEKVGQVEMALSVIAVLEAINKIGDLTQEIPFGSPCLFVNPSRLGDAREIISRLTQHATFEYDYELNDYEWYVSWGGVRAGSAGC